LSEGFSGLSPDPARKCTDRVGGEGGPDPVGGQTNLIRVTSRAYTASPTEGTNLRDPVSADYTAAVGFDPYRRVRRARLTRRSELVFLVVFLALFVAVVVWAIW
jgi:hypothetical protein